VYFLIIARDRPGQEYKRDELRPQRVAWLKQNKNLLLSAGGMVDDQNRHVQGGLMIVDAKNREEAERFAQTDPFVPTDLYESLEVIRWRRVFFNYEQVIEPDPFAPD
jgi:uncharacterized protein YciI